MSRSDARRWRDWRTNRQQPLREVRRCACGREFEPLRRGQRECLVCIGERLAAERKPAPVPDATPQIEQAEQRDAIRRMRRELDSGALEPVDGTLRGNPGPVLSPQAERKRKRRRKSRTKRPQSTAHPETWAFIARRRFKHQLMEPRTIAKQLGVPVDEVIKVLRGVHRPLPQPKEQQPAKQRPGEGSKQSRRKYRQKRAARASGKGRSDV